MAYDYKAKKKNITQLNQYMLAKTLSMFEYAGLPETIPARELERLLQVHGYAFITKANGELYAFTGGLGGKKDAYGNDTEIVISNPHINFNATLDINKDGVLIRNDDMMLGLLPFYEKQNTLLVENDINMVVWGYNSRTAKLISASDDKTKESADLYLKKIVEGDITVIGESAFFDGVKVQNNNNTAGVTVQSLIEYHQYLQAKMFNEVGLAANFNMKRERLISSEVDQEEDSLFPLVYNMMANRIAAAEAINAMFDQNIIVNFGSVWHTKNEKLVDGIPDNNSDVPNPEQPPESSGSPEPEQSGEPEATSTNTETETELEQEQETVTGGEGTGSDTDPETDPASATTQTAEELQAIIDDPDSSDEDKQAARELLAELEKENV